MKLQRKFRFGVTPPDLIGCQCVLGSHRWFKMFERQLPEWAPLHTATHRAKVSLVRRKWHRCDRGGVRGVPTHHGWEGQPGPGMSAGASHGLPSAASPSCPGPWVSDISSLLPSLKNMDALSSTGIKSDLNPPSGTKQFLPAITLHLGSHQESV